jgi:hypothetical protein
MKLTEKISGTPMILCVFFGPRGGSPGQETYFFDPCHRWTAPIGTLPFSAGQQLFVRSASKIGFVLFVSMVYATKQKAFIGRNFSEFDLCHLSK